MNEKMHKILAVTEGGLNFIEDDQYGLANMLGEVKGWEYHDGATLHRFSVDMRMFDSFAGQSMAKYVEDGKFSQLWLFGKGKNPANGEKASLFSDEEIAELDALMRGGLGLFATGDHEDIGSPLCSNLPRVRFLRNWNKSKDPSRTVPAQSGPLMVDTRSPPLLVTKSGLADDVDSTPKTVWARNAILSNGIASQQDPHPLCFHPDFLRLSFLPDHMHEGICCVPPAGVEELKGQVEADFPPDSICQVVAWTVRAGYLDGRPAQPYIHPILSCFDTVEGKMGRVVTDSTFHHWTWGNIEAIKNASAVTVAWDHIRQYPKNIAAWLGRVQLTTDTATTVAASLQLQKPVLDALRLFVDDESEKNLADLGESVIEAVGKLKLDSGEVQAHLLGLDMGAQLDRSKLGGAVARIAKSRRLLGLHD